MMVALGMLLGMRPRSPALLVVGFVVHRLLLCGDHDA